MESNFQGLGYHIQASFCQLKFLTLLLTAFSYRFLNHSELASTCFLFIIFFSYFLLSPFLQFFPLSFSSQSSLYFSSSFFLSFSLSHCTSFSFPFNFSLLFIFSPSSVLLFFFYVPCFLFSYFSLFSLFLYFFPSPFFLSSILFILSSFLPYFLSSQFFFFFFTSLFLLLYFFPSIFILLLSLLFTLYVPLFFSLAFPFFPLVLGLPWSAAKCPPSLSLPLPNRKQGKGVKNLLRLLTSYSKRQNRVDLMKIYLLPIKKDLGREK